MMPGYLVAKFGRAIMVAAMSPAASPNQTSPPEEVAYTGAVAQVDWICNYRISLNGLVRVCGLKAATLREILDNTDEMVPTHTEGKALRYTLGVALRAICRHQRKRPNKVEVDGEKLTMEEAKTRDLLAAAKQKEWKLAMEQGKFLPRDQVERDFDELARVITTWVDTLPAAIDPEMRREVKRELERGIRSLSKEVEE